MWDRTIEKYNANLLAMLQKRNDPNVVIVDMREIISGGHHNYLENTHPNASGYKVIADTWFKALMDSDVFN
jgi:lysophospholipase L1-like esterase